MNNIEKDKAIEVNVSIANFLGLEKGTREYADNYSCYDKGDVVFKCPIFGIKGLFAARTESELCFNRSWDEIMPAITKIEKRGYEFLIGKKDDEYFVTKVYYSGIDEGIEKAYDEYCKTLSLHGLVITWNEDKLLSAFEAVEKCIEWLKIESKYATIDEYSHKIEK